MVQDGQFDRENFRSGPSMPSSPGETHCAAVSASAWVEPHGKCTVAFALAWSSPKVKFLKGSSYHRRYTKFYGSSEGAAQELVHDALMNYKRWEEDIEKWQNPILKDERLPEWYKFTLFNELYFLVAGGTVWIDSRLPAQDRRNHYKAENTAVKVTEAEVNLRDGAVVKHTTTSDYNSEDESIVNSEGSYNHFQHRPITLLNEQNDIDDVGRFLYLEGVEYVMWCTYDVHFYASFALLELFPKIELNIQRDFAKAVLSEDGRKVKFLAEGNTGIRKVRGAVPHDLGMHDPWSEMNAYNIHDTSKWKDLNPKFVLQVYRDFAATGDMSFGVDVWPAVRAAMEYMEQFDRDGDCLIENDGFPDQTYDTWTVHGVSAYCGCLWLAALQAAAAMALQLGDKPFAEYCKSKYLKAKPAFEEKLWNGSYFNYDSGSSSNSKSIQADQLAGQWYTASSGLSPLFDETKIKSSLQKIYDFNVMKVKGGRMGAVNGMHPNGKVDETCMQSREIWAGVTYGVAATMILAGMEKEAFATAEGIFTAGWSEEGYGYWFQTPEAWTMDGHFRSLIYMRPLSIWGMQWALSMPKAILEAPEINIMDGTNFADWEMDLRILLESERLWYVLEAPIHVAIPPESTPEEHQTFQKWKDDDLKVRSYIFGSLTQELKRQYIDMSDAYSMITRLRELFMNQEQVLVHSVAVELFHSRLDEGQPVSPYVLHLIDLIDQLRRCDFPLNDTLGRSLILGSLPSSFCQFVLNFNMQGIRCSYSELHRMLLTAEEDLKNGVSTRLQKPTSLSL